MQSYFIINYFLFYLYIFYIYKTVVFIHLFLCIFRTLQTKATKPKFDVQMAEK